MSGLPEIISNCSSMLSPPTTRPQRRPWLLFRLSDWSPALSPACSPPSSRQPRTSSLPTLRIWRASSRVGRRMRARAPKVEECRPPRRSTRGTRKARLLPEPVRAIPTRSRGGLERRTGIESRWIGVGVRKPWSIRERRIHGESPEKPKVKSCCTDSDGSYTHALKTPSSHLSLR